MNDLAIVCLIATWHGEQLLAEAVASAAPHVDRVVVLDGVYRDVPVEAGPTWSDGETELIPAVNAGAVMIPAPWPPGTTYADEIAKRNVLLEHGRAALADVPGDRWALVLDEDELLMNGHRLREWVHTWGPLHRVPGLMRVEPDGQTWAAPSRLFALTDWLRYRERSYWLSYGPGQPPVSLEHDRRDAYDPHDVHVRHRWNDRSPKRAEAQRAWGRRLAELDHGAA